MYAIVEIAGQQWKVENGKKLFVNRLDAEQDSIVEFDKVLLLDNEGEVQVGAPVVEGVKISAKVLEHTKGDKVIIFKKKRRKGYKVKKGHRQFLTQLQVEEIITNGSTSKAKEKPAEATQETQEEKQQTQESAQE